jgi:hypothetical protein
MMMMMMMMMMMATQISILQNRIYYFVASFHVLFKNNSIEFTVENGHF